MRPGCIAIDKSHRIETKRSGLRRPVDLLADDEGDYPKTFPDPDPSDFLLSCLATAAEEARLGPPH